MPAPSRAILLSLFCILFTVAVTTAVPAHPPDPTLDGTMQPPAISSPTVLLYTQNARNSQNGNWDRSDDTTGASTEQVDTNDAAMFLDFLQMPAPEKRRDYRGYVLRHLGDNRVRIEVYLGEQVTPGHRVEIEDIIKQDDTVTVHVSVDHPRQSTTLGDGPAYPAAAAEFELPDGDYTVNVRLKEETPLDLNVG